MRCELCSKFVSLDTDTEPEITRESLDNGFAEVEVRIVNNCADCGSELRSADLSVSYDFSEAIEAHYTAKPECRTDKGGQTLTAEASRTDRTQNKDRAGRQIRSSRYMKRFYGAEVVLSISCDECGDEIDSETVGDEVQASGMDEC